MIHYVSFFDFAWRNERNCADALEWHGYHVTRYQITDPKDRPGLGGKPAIKPGDVVFTAVPQNFDVAELQRFKDAGAKLVTWYWDWIFGLENRADLYLPRLRLMDVILSTDGFSDENYVRNGITCRHYLPQAAMPEDRLLPSAVGSPKHDVVFMGHLWTSDRRDMARRLNARFNFANYGGYSEGTRRVWGCEMTRICRGSSIMVGVNYKNDCPGYWSDRCYVVMGAGGFYLGQRVPGIERYFQDGVHCAFFDGMDDLMEKTAWWLAHDKEREACRKRGHELVHSRDTYIHRTNEMLATLRKMRVIR